MHLQFLKPTVCVSFDLIVWYFHNIMMLLVTCYCEMTSEMFPNSHSWFWLQLLPFAGNFSHSWTQWIPSIAHGWISFNNSIVFCFNRSIWQATPKLDYRVITKPNRANTLFKSSRDFCKYCNSDWRWLPLQVSEFPCLQQQHVTESQNAKINPLFFGNLISDWYSHWL